MNKLQQVPLDEGQNDSADAPERRRGSRTRVARPVYIRPADPSENNFEEVQITTDFSNVGLHFITAQKDCYRKGMQLYMIPVLGWLNFECLGEVVRIEPRPDGKYGIAVKLLRLGKPVVDVHTVGRSAFRASNVLRVAETWTQVSPVTNAAKKERQR